MNTNHRKALLKQVRMRSHHRAMLSELAMRSRNGFDTRRATNDWDNRSTFDDGRRLTGETLGNGVTKTRTFSTDNLLTGISYGGTGTSIGNLSYTWDANKNKTSETIGGTMSGSGFTAAGTSNVDEDRLTGYARTSGTLTQSWNLTKVGDWTSVTTNGTAQNRTHGPTHELLTAGGQNVSTDATNLFGSFTLHLSAYTLPPTSFASYIDEPVVRKAAGTSGTIHYYHRNQQYSITAMTKSTGAVAERYAYTAYGQPTILNASGSVLTSSAVGNRYTYTGREWDETLGLHHFRARWVSPLAGRFLGRDPIGYVGSPLNLFEYVKSQPLFRTDPSGKIPPIAIVPIIIIPLIFQGCNSAPKPRGEDVCCYEAFNAGWDKGAIGGVICCDGRKVSCVWQQGGWNATDPKAVKIVDKCVKKHEDDHHQRLGACTPDIPSLYRPRSYVNHDKDECLAYRVEYQCLKSSISECGGDSICTTEVNKEIAQVALVGSSHCRAANIPADPNSF